MEETAKIKLIKENPKKAINKLVIPATLTMFLIVSYNFIDTIWVAGLGPNALAAIGVISPLFMIMMAFGSGMGIATTSFIARSIGKEDKQLTNNGVIHVIIITLILSIIIPLIIIPLLAPTFDLLDSIDYLKSSIDYATPLFLCTFVFFFQSIFLGMLRAEGEMTKVSYTTIVGVLINLFLDPLFIYIFNWGISGAAWTTVLSAAITCLIILYWILIKKNTYVTISKKDFKPSKAIVFDLFKISIPAAIELFAVSILSIGINILLIIVGTENDLAIFTAGLRLSQFAIIPIMGIGTVLVTIAGTAYGAKNIKNLKIGFDYSLKLALICSIIICLILYIFAPQISYIFCYTSSSDSLMFELTQFLKIFTLYIFPIFVGVMCISILDGAGKGFHSLTLGLIQSILLELAFAILFGYYFNEGSFGVYKGLIIGNILGAILAYTWISLFIKKTGKKFYLEKNS